MGSISETDTIPRDEESTLNKHEWPPGWAAKTETEKSTYIKKLLDNFFSTCTEPIQEALSKRYNVPLEQVRDIKRNCQHYEEDFLNTMKQRSKYFFLIDFKDTKNLMRQLEYIWMKTENKSLVSPMIKIVILELFSAQKLFTTKKGRAVVFNEQIDVNKALQKFFLELGTLTKLCRSKLQNYADRLSSLHAKTVSIKIMHEWCDDNGCSEDTASPFIQAVIHTIEKKLSQIRTTNSKWDNEDDNNTRNTSVQNILQSLALELGNFQRMFEHPSVTVLWSKSGNQSTWNEDPVRRRKNILDQLHNQSHRLKRYSGVHLIPPVYARCNGKLTKFTYKPSSTSTTKPQFVHTTKISHNVHKATDHLHTSYNFHSKCGKDVVQVLADKNIVYVLLVIFPKFELSSEAQNGYQVQAYVGSANDGLMDAWFFRPGSHLQNAMDLLHYYKIHCKCNQDNHMSSDGSHRHYPPRHPPQLIDCVLLYARLKGYDTELYIVDKAQGRVESQTEALLRDKRYKWLHTLTASENEWGLNTTQERSCYVIDFRNDNNPSVIIKQVESLWKHQMRSIHKQDDTLNTIKAVITDIFGAESPPYVIDNISTVRNAIDSRIRELERLQAIYLSETRKITSFDRSKIETLGENATVAWLKNKHSSAEIPNVVESAIKDISDIYTKEENNKKKPDPNMILLKIHKQLVIFGALFDQKKLGIGWNNAAVSTWDADPRVRRANVLDELFWQRVSLKRMQFTQLLDMLPPVYAKFGDGLARCVSKSKPIKGVPQSYSSHFDCAVFKGENKHLQNINFLQNIYNKRKPEKSDKADYNATGLQNVEMLTDKRVIYILAVSFPKSAVDKKANCVQCFVGKASNGIRDKWHRQSKSHLRNARDMIEYFCSGDPPCPHMPVPPPLVDCMLVYARLMGYDTALYIVDQLLALGSVRPDTVKTDKLWCKILDAELEKKKQDWIKAIRSSDMLYGLNTDRVIKKS